MNSKTKGHLKRAEDVDEHVSLHKNELPGKARPQGLLGGECEPELSNARENPVPTLG